MDARTIEIRQGAIRIRDPRVELAILALRTALVLHVVGLTAILAAALAREALNPWLIAAATSYALGLVSALGSLAFALQFSGNADSLVRRAWKERADGRIASRELLGSVEPFHPGMSEPGPVFGWLAAAFFTGACILFVAGLPGWAR